MMPGVCKVDLHKELPNSIWFPNSMVICRGTPLEMLREMASSLRGGKGKKTLKVPVIFETVLAYLEKRGFTVDFEPKPEYTDDELARILVSALLTIGVARPCARC